VITVIGGHDNVFDRLRGQRLDVIDQLLRYRRAALTIRYENAFRCDDDQIVRHVAERVKVGKHVNVLDKFLYLWEVGRFQSSVGHERRSRRLLSEQRRGYEKNENKLGDSFHEYLLFNGPI
jgi:hypothetical protein